MRPEGQGGAQGVGRPAPGRGAPRVEVPGLGAGRGSRSLNNHFRSPRHGLAPPWAQGYRGRPNASGKSALEGKGGRKGTGWSLSSRMAATRLELCLLLPRAHSLHDSGEPPPPAP